MKVTKDIEVIDFLLKKRDLSKSKIKSLLKYKAIKVNGKRINKNILLKVNDIVEINKLEKVEDNILDILYEDKDIIVVNKKAGLLTISTAKENEKTLYSIVRNYVKRKNKNARIFIVHRLDKDTSGIVIFAKNEKVKLTLQNNWDKLVLKRGYIAICDGIFEKREGTIRNYLDQNKNNYVYITNNGGKLAITHYKVIKSNNKYSLLQIYLETGRKNQIRVHMKGLNHPILGDNKYGNNNNPINRLCLIANELVFIHPTNQKEMSFKLDIPISFMNLVK